jgi:hypothetical protein
MHDVAERIRESLPGAIAYRLKDFDNRRQATAALSIYMNQARPLAKDPRRVPRASRPQAIVAIVREHEDSPPPPSGWKVLDKFPRGNGWWYIYTRPPARRDAGTSQREAAKPAATTSTAQSRPAK